MACRVGSAAGVVSVYTSQQARSSSTTTHCKAHNSGGALLPQSCWDNRTGHASCLLIHLPTPLCCTYSHSAASPPLLAYILFMVCPARLCH